MKKKKILKFIRNLLIIFFGSSILSVIALRFIPVYFTPLMFIRTAQQIIHGEDIKWKHTWVSKEKMCSRFPPKRKEEGGKHLVLPYNTDMIRTPV